MKTVKTPSREMTPNELSQFVKRIAYKPGWRMEIHDDRRLTVGFLTDCSGHACNLVPADKHPHQTWVLVTWGIVLAIPNEVKRTVEWMIDHLERHDRAENLTLDGEMFLDPHDRSSITKKPTFEGD